MKVEWEQPCLRFDLRSLILFLITINIIQYNLLNPPRDGVFFKDQPIGLMSRVFANGLQDQGSILGRVIPKTQKMVLDTALLNTQHYKVKIKGKVEQSRERSCALSYTSV